jgi:hypothetical protein
VAKPERAREDLVHRVLSLVLGERADEDWAHYDAYVGYCRDAVDAAAKDLVVALAAEEQGGAQ